MSNILMNQTQRTPEVQAMWVKLEGFQLDKEDAVFDFSTRLARENGWSSAYTARVIQEYKRFLLLAMHAHHPVTPSDEVDQAWHLHLVYTRSYWEDLCRDTLGRPLHHGPTRGGESEAEKFADWYDKTLQSYARLFGEQPPTDIWPESAVRFDRKARFERVDRSLFWLMPKFSLRKPAMAAGIAAAALGLVACEAEALLGDDGYFWFVGVVVLVGVIYLGYRTSKHRGGRGGNGGCGSSSCGGFSGGASGCGSSGHSGCGSHGGTSGCGSSGCAGGGGCGGGGGD